MSGGFAIVQPNSVLSINAVEGYPLEDFSADAVKAQISEAQKVANGSGSEQDIAEAKIELEVRMSQELDNIPHCYTNVFLSLGSGESAGCAEINCITLPRQPCSIDRAVSYNHHRIQTTPEQRLCIFSTIPVR